ncbi:MAG: AbrB/MazE/SpoVT family DNA-binding domain-containing protein [Elusimicrobia bacterium]|nr:AbrB/MazE/SpoVT family DNA-binding domain-containing protein [Elusimicrobiota bacterium]
MVTRMRGKGQVTIPAGIRESLSLSTDSLLSVTKVGNGILLTPKPSAFEETAAKFSKTAREKGITLRELLNDLKNVRRKG